MQALLCIVAVAVSPAVVLADPRPERLPVANAESTLELSASQAVPPRIRSDARELLPAPTGAGDPPESPHGRQTDMQLAPHAEVIARPSRMTLEDLNAIAFANNPTLVRAAADIEAARGNWVQVGLRPNPNIGYLGNQIGDSGTAGQQGAYVEQEFVRGGKLPLNRDVAAREIAIAQQRYEAQRRRVSNDIKIQFYNTLVAQRMLEISQDLLTVGERGAKAANDLFNARETNRTETLQARIEVNNARIAVANAQYRVAASWRRLAALMGVPDMQRSDVEGNVLADMPSFSWEDSVGRILTESPDLAATRIGVDRAVRALRRARAEPIPNVIVQAGPQYDFAGRDTIANVSASLPVPIFNYNQGNIRRAEAEVRSARAEVSRQELELTTRLAATFERYASARNQVQLYRDEVLPDAQEALGLATKGYRGGEMNYLALLTAQRTFFYTNLAYYSAVRDFWEASITIDGLLLTDSLQSGGNTSVDATTATPNPVPNNPFLGR